MSFRNKLKLQRRRVRRYFWLFATAAVSALLFDKQVAVLFAIWTLTMSGLLIVEAFLYLEAKDAEMQAVAIGEHAQSSKYKLQRTLIVGRRAA